MDLKKKLFSYESALLADHEMGGGLLKFSQSKILKNLNRYFGILLRLGYYENHEIAQKT